MKPSPALGSLLHISHFASLLYCDIAKGTSPEVKQIGLPDIGLATSFLYKVLSIMCSDTATQNQLRHLETVPRLHLHSHR
jgi:hypothetical protein